jgi:hypothetical protein
LGIGGKNRDSIIAVPSAFLSSASMTAALIQPVGEFSCWQFDLHQRTGMAPKLSSMTQGLHDHDSTMQPAN